MQRRRKLSSIQRANMSRIDCEAEVRAVLKTARTRAKGTIGDPLNDAERRRKFDDCCVPVLGDAKSATLYAACNDLGSRPRRIIQIFASGAGTPVIIAHLMQPVVLKAAMAFWMSFSASPSCNFYANN